MSANCDALNGGIGGGLIPFRVGTIGLLVRIPEFDLIGVEIDLLLSESIEPLLDIFFVKRF